MTSKFRRGFLKKQTISPEEYDRIEQESESAQELLEDDRFKFFRDYLKNAQQSIAQSIIENRITEVKEVLKVSDKLKRIFTTPKKVQVDELVGQYKLVSQILSDLESTSKLKDELVQAVKNKAVILESDDEKI